MKVIGLFPGQGAQLVGMGRDLYEKCEIAQEYFSRADKILGFELSKLCFEGPIERLTMTEIVQPAILTVSTICYQVAKIKQPELSVTAVAGHSLGEYSALVAAEAIKFDDAVLLVHKRGKYMQEAVPAGQGRMLAVLGKEVSEIEALLENFPNVQIANINAPGQIVVSGNATEISEFQTKASGWKIIELTVSAPFHCKLMQPAANKLAKDLDETQFIDAKIPVYANVDAKPYTAAAQIRANLKEQVCSPVRWLESMQEAVSSGVSSCIEFGPGSVLTGLMKRIDKSVERKNISSLSDL